ncbi:hypothetical protein ABEB36_003856 [Hypothenemus hampei]|uniref:Uncharacterized protein n=1 Tax=Hypothenemus hampei TaxID=57062 RepID=A0ABD1F1C1_HYPHA
MAQAFISTYKKSFRWHQQLKIDPCDSRNLPKFEPEGETDLNKELDEELKDISKIKKAIHKFYLARMRSTYYISYCDKIEKCQKNVSRSSSVMSKLDELRDSCQEGLQETFENELLEYCKNLYSNKNKKIIPPLDTTRNIFGYMRPTRLLTPISIYQHKYGRIAYDILKKAHKSDGIIQ